MFLLLEPRYIVIHSCQCHYRLSLSLSLFESSTLIDLLVIALVLVPTRELCMQVYEILQKLLHRFHWIVPGYITGGENRSKEKARLRKGKKVCLVLI
jgi:superfamily II DNA/RNA helicase